MTCCTQTNSAVTLFTFSLIKLNKRRLNTHHSSHSCCWGLYIWWIHSTDFHIVNHWCNTQSPPDSNEPRAPSGPLICFEQASGDVISPWHVCLFTPHVHHWHSAQARSSSGLRRRPASVQPLPEGTVFPGQKVADKPLPVVNLNDTDTKQAPKGGSCVTAEPKHLSVPFGFSWGHRHDSHIPARPKKCGKESLLNAYELSTKSPTDVRSSSSLFSRNVFVYIVCLKGKKRKEKNKKTTSKMSKLLWLLVSIVNVHI